MDSTGLYGYIPTFWIAIVFASSCLFTLCTMIPVLFFRYRNVILGVFIITGLIFQLAGHASMAVSSFLPTNIPAWITQRLAFSLGKLCARVAVCYVYYTALRRIPNAFPEVQMRNERPEEDLRSDVTSYICGISIFGFLLRFIVQGAEIGSIVKGSLVLSNDSDRMLSITSSTFILSTSIVLGVSLVIVISRTRKEIPWFRLTWMAGYYVTLQIVPVLLLMVDVYDFAISFFPYRYEMAELVCDIGMTNGILTILGTQTYEMAYSWSQKRPKALEKIELQVKGILENRRQASLVNGNTN